MKSGQHITPTIRLSRLLGKGGMGSVWVADHLALNTEVAVKFMSASFIENASLVQRFRTEAMAAAQIKSPHIAQVFDHGIMEDGTPFIVMELLEGEDLKQRIRREGPLPLKDVAHVVTQASKALARAHALGIVHRDIKPDNIFLCSIDGETFCKVLDFGIAKMGSDNALGATTTGSMMGTPLYMSPEQLLSAKRVDHRSDLWSLAVVAYHAIAGRVPFRGETVGSLSVAVHTGIFDAPSTLRSDVPAAVDAWFLKTLQRDPNNRFATAKEMADALEVAITGAPPMSVGRLPMPSRSEALTPPPVSGPMAMTPQGTLVGTATTNATTSKSKVPAFVALGGAVIIALVSALVFFLRGGTDGVEPSPAAQAAPIQLPSSSSSSVPTPAPAPTPTLMVVPDQPAEAPTTTGPAKQAADKATATTQDKPTAKTAPPPPTKKTVKAANDTIGF